MSKIEKYDKITFEMEDTFHVMDAAERDEHFSVPDPNRMAIYYPEEHIIVALHKMKINRILSLIADKSAVRSRMKANVMNSGMDAEMLEDYQMIVAKNLRLGFRYAYTADGDDYISDVLMILHKNMYYTVNCFFRKENKEAAMATFTKLLESITIEK